MGDILPFRQFRRSRLAALRGLWQQRLDRLATHLDTLSAGGTMPALALIAPKDEPIITSAKPRILEAPLALVWKCFSEREFIARWWGPKSIGELTVREFDFRVGGKWRFDHALKRGPVIGFHGVYRAIEPMSRIVNTFAFDGLPDGAEVEESHLFEAHGETTHYTSILRCADFATRDGMLASGMEKGAEESMRQLEAVLGELKTPSK
jgi:uncharacterized protein YndB with AHSA1/START domain